MALGVIVGIIFNSLGWPFINQVEEGAIILGVDRLLDMMRMAVNISGDAVVTAIVAKGERKRDMAIFDDPTAGLIDDADFAIDAAAEARLAAALRHRAGDQALLHADRLTRVEPANLRLLGPRPI